VLENRVKTLHPRNFGDVETLTNFGKQLRKSIDG
jgi:hypothetical protein